jgi:hypothetical protein
VTDFQVGDRVTALRYPGAVTYGPFSSTFDRHTMYVVKQDDGNERSYQATDLTALPAFAVGDTVTTNAGATGTLLAGPYDSVHADEVFWVLERSADGKHLTPLERAMAKVAPANTYTHDGVTYDLDAKYRDSEGDLWEFTGRRHGNGSPVICCAHSGYDTVSDAVGDYGPLTKIND